MAVAQTSVFSSKLKLYEPLASMLEGQKFLKWTESNSSSDKYGSALPNGVILKTDPKCFILYWRDLNKKKYQTSPQTSSNISNNINTFNSSISNSKNMKKIEPLGLLKSDYLDICSIRDIRTGKYANVPKDKNSKDILLSGKSNASIQDKTISIYYGPDLINIQCINFVSMSEIPEKIAKGWTDFLFKCIVNQRMQNLSPWDNLIKLRSCLLYGKSVIDDKNREFKLPVQILIETFINGRSIESERQHIVHALQSIGLPSGKNDMLDEKTLSIDKFFRLFLHLVSKEDIEQIYSNYASKRKLYLTPEQFENFLNKEQRDPGLNELLYPFYTTDKAAEMIQKFEIDESFRKKKQLSPQGLMRYLMDFENEVVDPIKYELNEDMEQPLSHYFINSSHNTYLTGHQITGKSDAEMYRQVLLSGCRCIELDCHEDDSLDEPVITHGRTLCTKILFSEAIQAINESAFKTSPYPVLLSFENFCGKRMQEKMVKYLKDIFGDQLLMEPLFNYPLKPGVQLPSPEDLKYKILVKFRKKRSEKVSSQTALSSYKNECISNINDHPLTLVRLTSVTHNLSEFDFNSSYNSSSGLLSTPTHLPATSSSSMPSKLIENKNSFSRNDSQQTNSDSSDSEKEDDFNRKSNNLKSSNSASLASSNNEIMNSQFNKESSYFLEMAQLVNYIQPTRFRSFEISEKKNRSYEMSSFVETAAFNLHKDKPTEFVNYNKRQLSRIYPKGTRISSDNFLPQIFWNVGCQLVALNFQTLDIGMQLNLGKFEYNNRSGFLLKPEIMRRTDVNKLFDPFTESPLDGIVATTLKIRIISGIYLNCARTDSEKKIGYAVTVELYGLPADSVRGQKAHRVKAASSNTFNVIYSDPTGFTFKKIILPQLALIKISVFDDQNKQMGHRVLPVVGLRPGYRYICLKNEANQAFIMSCLFVHIQMHDYVPEEFEDFATALVNPISFVTSLSKKEEMLKTLTDENEALNTRYGLYDLDDPNENQIEIRSNEVNKNLKPDYMKRNSWTNPVYAKRLSNIYDFGQIEEKTETSRATRYSLSVEKFNKINLEPKGKSQLDLSNFKFNSNLNNTIYNMHRSCSLYCTENDCLEMQKYKTNISNLNDPSLFLEIEIEDLKNNKTYQQILKNYSKKIDKIEKETEKKINELEQALINDINKLRSNMDKEKLKLEKSKKKLNLKLIKTSKSSIDFNSTNHASTSSNLINNFDLKHNILIENLQDSLNLKLKNSHSKYLDSINTVYEESINNIKNLQLSSIQPLYGRLEKLVFEIFENRMHQLKLISEKEISIVNKQAHQFIKSKRKILSKSIQDKEEFQRLIKKVEKESVSFAVQENSKLEDLFKVKQKLIKQILDNSLTKLKELKEKQTNSFNSESIKKILEKKSEMEKKFSFFADLKTSTDLNKKNLSKSTSDLNELRAVDFTEFNKNETTHL